MTDVNPEYKGARFYKCALQVNPWAYIKRYGKPTSYENENDYNNAMAESCEENGIQVVGLADHGSVDTSESLREKLREKGIVVFPGFEIAGAGEIHMVCLYPENTEANKLNGYLALLMGDNFSKLSENLMQTSSLSCEEIAKKIKNEQDGFWYAAHALEAKGILRLSGDGDNYKDLWKNDGLVQTIQIQNTINDIKEESKKDIILNKNIEYKRTKPIVVINANDVIDPGNLARPTYSCLIKMTNRNFAAFKNAFHDSESRIRLINPERSQDYCSYIKSVRWEGAGFFEQSALAFSQHLNAVIGGRGTGKSTLLESIRYALDLPIISNDEKKRIELLRKGNFQDSKVILEVKSKKQNQNCYTITRRFGESPIVINEAGDVSNLTPRDILPNIEFLGQNEILEIEKNKDLQIDLIRGFLPDNIQLEENIITIQKRLGENRNRIIKAQSEFDALGEEILKKEKLTESLGQFTELGIAEKLKNVKFLTAENNIKEQITTQLSDVKRWLDDYQSVFDLNFLESDDINQMPNARIILEQIKPSLTQLKENINQLTQKAIGAHQSALEQIKTVTLEWKKQSGIIQDELNQAIAQLPEHAGNSGQDLGRQYNAIIKKLVSIDAKTSSYQQQKKIIKQLNDERRNLLEEYRNTAFTRFEMMRCGVKKLNRTLSDKVRIVVKSKGNCENLINFLLGINGIGEGKLKWLKDVKSGIDLVHWSELIAGDKRNDFLIQYKDNGLTTGTVDNLFKITMEERLELEEIELKDTVTIELNVEHNNNIPRYVPLGHLSPGQKCTAILNLLLLNRDDPLIVDQPEDNLDNAFIAERIVQDLRALKTKRQFLFATHNANIPIFGDAELIAALASEKGKGAIKYQGSIDDSAVSQQAANILEGGKEAFNTRKNKYGF